MKCCRAALWAAVVVAFATVAVAERLDLSKEIPAVRSELAELNKRIASMAAKIDGYGAESSPEGADLVSSVDAMEQATQGQSAEVEQAVQDALHAQQGARASEGEEVELDSTEFNMDTSKMDAWTRRRYEILAKAATMAEDAEKRAGEAKAQAAKAIKEAEGDEDVRRQKEKAIEIANLAIERSEEVLEQAHMREFLLLHTKKGDIPDDELLEGLAEPKEILELAREEGQGATGAAEGGLVAAEEEMADDMAADVAATASTGSTGATGLRGYASSDCEEELAEARAEVKKAQAQAEASMLAPKDLDELLKNSPQVAAQLVKKLYDQGAIPAPSTDPTQMLRNVVEADKLEKALEANREELERARELSDVQHAAQEAARKAAEVRSEKRALEAKLAKTEAQVRATFQGEMMDEIRHEQAAIKRDFDRKIAAKVAELRKEEKKQEAVIEHKAEVGNSLEEALRYAHKAKEMAVEAQEHGKHALHLSAATGVAGVVEDANEAASNALEMSERVMLRANKA